MKSAVRGRNGRPRGATLVELIAALLILTVGVLGLMGGFRFITKAISYSRVRTIASNLAQEKVESLKNLSYYALLVTTVTTTNSNFSPALVYDSVSYPPQTFPGWGTPPLTRAAFVAFAVASGNSISTVAYTSNDTGLKLITTHVFWNQNGTWMKVTLNNLLENPNVSALDTLVSGTVSKPGGGGLAGALVQVVTNPQWQATTASNGSYSFQVAHGSYTVSASSAGYLTASAAIAPDVGLPVTFSPTLTAIASGTVASNSVYVSSNLVVSQVVASTVTQAGDGTTHDIEYVELFNPTKSAVTVSGASIRLNYLGAEGASNQTNFPLTYVTASIPPLGYYLISSATNFFVSGGWVSADAYYAAPLALYQDVIQAGKAGAIQITDSAGNVIDGVGWSHTAGGVGAPWSQGTAVPQAGGLAAGSQLVRMSSACANNAGYGRAYSSYNNANNFFYNGAPGSGAFAYSPYSASVTKPVIAGVAAAGGFAVANDGLSSQAQLVTTNAATPAPWSQTCPNASFSLPSVATGTWTAYVSTGNWLLAVGGVAVSQGATTSILSDTTDPAWPAANFNVTAVTATTNNGYVQGTVADAAGNPISGITVTGTGSSAATGASGQYFLIASPGAQTLSANVSSPNPSYISASANVTVMTGRVAANNFTLSQGGRIYAYVATAALTPLAGIVVTATNTTGGASGSSASDASGYAFISNLATGAYSVTPTFDSSQSASPASFNPVNLTTPGSTVFAGTFTVTGAFSTLTGTATASGSPITTGVLVIASSAAISNPPPAINGSNSASGPFYYAAPSLTDGTYQLLVRASTGYTYNMAAFYPTVDVNTGATSYSMKTLTAVSVSTPGATVSGENFAW